MSNAEQMAIFIPFVIVVIMLAVICGSIWYRRDMNRMTKPHIKVLIERGAPGEIIRIGSNSFDAFLIYDGELYASSMGKECELLYEG